MSNDTPDIFKLPAVLDLAAADDFLDAMRHRVDNGALLRMDASAVETLTFPCVQVILATLRNHTGTSIENPSSAFVEAFADLALDFGGARQTDGAQSSPETLAQPPATAQPPAAQPESLESSPVPDQPVDESPMTKRILTIDDSKTMRDMLNVTLTDAGFEVLQAVDGQDGLRVLGE